MRSWVAVVVSAAVTGCVVYKDDSSTTGVQGDGQVQVGWLVGSSGCEASGVETIEVSVGSAVDTFPCADESAILSVAPGTYDVTLRGLDVDGMPRYGGDGGTVSVFSGQTTAVPTVVMSALPATVTTTWYFENAHLCSANGVQDVEVDLFDADDTLQATMTAPCDDGVAILTDVEAGAYALLVLGRDATGNQTYSGQTQVTLLRGDDIQVDVELIAD